MPKQKSMNTRMARAFFRHYEHKHQLMKQHLSAQSPALPPPAPLPSNFSFEFSQEFA